MAKEDINNGLIERIQQLMDYKSLTQRSLSMQIGFSYSTLNKYCNKKSNTIDFELVYLLISHFSDINPKWLIEGEQPMLSKENENNAQNIERIESLVDTIATLQKTINEKTKTIQSLEEANKRLTGELAMMKNERKIG